MGYMVEAATVNEPAFTCTAASRACGYRAAPPRADQPSELHFAKECSTDPLMMPHTIALVAFYIWHFPAF